ncbi:ABC transporter ATP-binding protein [Aquamicrobium sp. LC103]|uniref:ABC transporter ATP-binding protein n=1 Tax=Aquamicrobium sp. LC103 TaxID=1120658 RepID=UPI00063E8CB4|nr:ABC transporter ATP-binding protein [Aquamicrobium sp. LC103]TKT75785.1 ABC transporter ATP-binding protein [Aquamicrobium sp. LC103]
MNVSSTPSGGKRSAGSIAADVNLLEAHALTKEFRGFIAVSGIDLTIKAGTIHALIGPNGAGKTTVFNLLTKFIEPSGGTILFKGEDVTRQKPYAIARKGIARSFQISAIFPHLSVRENVRIALQRPLGTHFQFWRPKTSLARLDERADELLERVNLTGMADRLAGELSYGRKRILELATTLALDPALLLLDEPMAGLGREDVDRISALVKQVSHGRTTLLVEHNLSVVEKLSDTITVLARGKVIAEGTYRHVATQPAVIEAYLGGDDD